MRNIGSRPLGSLPRDFMPRSETAAPFARAEALGRGDTAMGLATDCRSLDCARDDTLWGIEN